VPGDAQPIAVTAAKGKHTLSLWARDAGFTVDAVYVTNDSAVRPGERQAKAASDFLDSIGVNIHAGFSWTTYDDIGKVLDSLDYLGVRHLRDTLTDQGNWLQRIDQIGAQGYKFDFFINHGAFGLEWQLGQIAQRAGMLAAIEGPNETDVWPVTHEGLTGMEATRALMADLHAAVTADPVLSKFPLLQTSFAFHEAFLQAGDLSAFADFANTHSYLPAGHPPSTPDHTLLPPGAALDQLIREAQIVSPGLRPWTTEAGYHTATGSHPMEGVSEAVQGKYTPRLLLEQYARGVERTYLYELLDQAADPGMTDWQMHFGLFRADGTPKPAAEAIRAMTTLLRDDGRAFTPGTLDYTLKGMPGTADDLLLQESDGTFDLILWNDADNWDDAGNIAVEAPAALVTLGLISATGTIRIYSLSDGALLTTHTGTAGPQNITLALPDTPLLVEIRPAMDAVL
jgi:hypothetical protein